MPARQGNDSFETERKAAMGWILGLTASGVVIRFAFLLLAGDLEPYADESNYLYLALLLKRFDIYSDGLLYLWPPGYPCYLSLFLDLFGSGGIFAAKLCQVLLSGLIGFFLMLIAGRLYSGRVVRLTGMIWCIYLPLIGFTHFLWPETLYLALFLPGFYLLLRWWQETPRAAARNHLLVAAGLLFGASLLVKEIGLWWCLLVCVLIAFHDRKAGVLQALSRSALFLLAVTVIVIPWTLRNHEVYGRFAPVGATLGQNVFFGMNSPYMNFDYPMKQQQEIARANAAIRRVLTSPDAPPWERSEALNIIDQSSENVRRGLAHCLDHPGFALRTRIKLLADWATPMSFFVRHYGLERYQGNLNGSVVRKFLIAAGLLLPMLVLAAAIGGAVFRLRGSTGGLLGWTLLYFASTGSLIAGMSRYRISIEPLLIMLAAAFLARIGRRWGQRKRFILFLSGLALLIALWCVNAPEILAAIAPVW
ncbi:MAG: ArnT family glycosyltransferase [Planctomycetota bacterium]|jgi:hypothetical protein